jgi:hypothetical protein
MINLNILPLELQVKELQLRNHYIQHCLDMTLQEVPKERLTTLYFKMDNYMQQYWAINKPKKEKENQND